MSGIYSGIYQPRMFVDGKPLAPNLHELKGQKLVMRGMWTQEENDMYPGELALMPADKNSIDLFNKAGFFGWVASGDFIELTEIGGEV